MGVVFRYHSLLHLRNQKRQSWMQESKTFAISFETSKLEPVRCCFAFSDQKERINKLPPNFSHEGKD